MLLASTARAASHVVRQRGLLSGKRGGAEAAVDAGAAKARREGSASTQAAALRVSVRNLLRFNCFLVSRQGAVRVVLR